MIIETLIICISILILEMIDKGWFDRQKKPTEYEERIKKLESGLEEANAKFSRAMIKGLIK